MRPAVVLAVCVLSTPATSSRQFDQTNQMIFRPFDGGSPAANPGRPQQDSVPGCLLNPGTGIELMSTYCKKPLTSATVFQVRSPPAR